MQHTLRNDWFTITMHILVNDVWHDVVKSPSKSKKMKTTTYTALETVQKEFCNHTLSAESSRDWVGEGGGGRTGIQTEFPPSGI